jgi:hypothetical protein
MSLVDSLATYFGSVWLGYQKKQFNSGQVGALELGDIPWTGVPGSERKTFHQNDLNNLALLKLHPFSPLPLLPVAIRDSYENNVNGPGFLTKIKE